MRPHVDRLALSTGLGNTITDGNIEHIFANRDLLFTPDPDHDPRWASAFFDLSFQQS